mmetsp:Transcript_12626/g.25414  ORF Transcript_12626/g.25414 Transcript_12626/m.25414 type:complete len:228 (-) Transcript_12626:237-920(-)
MCPKQHTMEQLELSPYDKEVSRNTWELSDDLPSHDLDHTDSRTWTARWPNGQAAQLHLSNGSWTLFGQQYQLTPTSPVSFTWDDGTVQSVESWDGRTIMWMVTGPDWCNCNGCGDACGSTTHGPLYHCTECRFDICRGCATSQPSRHPSGQATATIRQHSKLALSSPDSSTIPGVSRCTSPSPDASSCSDSNSPACSRSPSPIPLPPPSLALSHESDEDDESMESWP